MGGMIVRNGACIDEINSANNERLFGFYSTIMINYSIRRIDNAFIPLFFHWSGRYIKRQLAGTLIFTIVIQCGFALKPVWGYGQEIIPSPIRETASEIVHMNLKSKFIKLNAYLQWKTPG